MPGGGYPILLVSEGDPVDVNLDPEVWAEVEACLTMQGYRSLDAFQEAHGLDVTGMLDPETLDALGVVLA